jgi:polysaccharide biosynthesis protein PslH
MRILQLCLRVPFPPSDGGTIAMYQMAESLHTAGCSVKIMAFNTRKHFVDPASVPEEFLGRYHPEWIYLDASVRLWPAFFNLLSNESYNISRFDSHLFRMELTRILKTDSFDAIIVESLFMAPYVKEIRAFSAAPVFLRAHNVEYQIWDRLAGSTKNIFKKYYLKLLTNRLKQFEQSMLPHWDGIIALTREDEELFNNLGNSKPVFLAPIGVDVASYQSESNSAMELFHLGSMDWMPNLEGVNWFLQNVVPKVVAQLPQIKIHLAGKGMPSKYFSMKNPNLIVQGKIDHAKQFMSDKQIMIVPLLSGGGMRVKIIEGMAMERTIISTSIGAEGIAYTDRLNMIIANTPGEFAEAIIWCFNHPDEAIEMGRQAAKLVHEKYNSRVIGTQILNFIKETAAALR